MRKIRLIFLILLVALVAGGAGFLATWDFPAPTRTVEKVIPNDRFR
jgi:cell division septal protein FtsQ